MVAPNPSSPADANKMNHRSVASMPVAFSVYAHTSAPACAGSTCRHNRCRHRQGQSETEYRASSLGRGPRVVDNRIVAALTSHCHRPPAAKCVGRASASAQSRPDRLQGPALFPAGLLSFGRARCEVDFAFIAWPQRFTSRSRGGRRATCITHHAARPPPTATVPSLVRHQSRQRPVGDTFARGFRRGSVLFGGLFGRVAWRSFAALAL